MGACVTPSKNPRVPLPTPNTNAATNPSLLVPLPQSTVSNNKPSSITLGNQRYQPSTSYLLNNPRITSNYDLAPETIQNSKFIMRSESPLSVGRKKPVVDPPTPVFQKEPDVSEVPWLRNIVSQTMEPSNFGGGNGLVRNDSGREYEQISVLKNTVLKINSNNEDAVVQQRIRGGNTIVESQTLSQLCPKVNLPSNLPTFSTVPVDTFHSILDSSNYDSRIDKRLLCFDRATFRTMETIPIPQTFQYNISLPPETNIF